MARMQKDRNQIKCKVCGEIFLQEDLIKEDRELAKG
jgi:formylmethanofuran dehydrogenase subunit E